MVSTDSIGDSSIATLSGACSTVILSPPVLCSVSSRVTRSRSPTRTISMPKSRAAAHRALDGRLGGEVTPHRVKRDSHAPLPRRLFRDLCELPSAVGAAVMAHAMRHRGLAALRAGDGIDRAQRVMGAALVALGTGSTTFGCLHGWLLFSVWIKICAASGAVEFQRSQNRQARVARLRSQPHR